MGKKVLITGGTGLIGQRLTELLLRKGYEVAFLSRKKTIIESVEVFNWDISKHYMDEKSLENISYLIHLAGAGVAEKRWTEDRKKIITSSRTEGLVLIARKLRELNIRPQALVSASGSSFYGEDTGNIRHTEASPAGSDFLSKVTVEWEKAADSIADLGVRTVKLRTGVVLSNQGGAIPKIALPARLGFGAPLGSGQQWMPWIHIDDICRMYIEAMENAAWQGAYNAVTSSPVTNEELTKKICKLLGTPQWLPNVPAFALKLALGEMSNVVLGSSYLINHRVAAETDFRYEYPEIGAALQDVLKK
jgi:uncharacterized protein (TIGR01777 family)